MAPGSNGAVEPEKPAPQAVFGQRVAATFGEAGRAWLMNLPALLDACAERWNLTVEPPVENLSYNYVAPARNAEGGQLILKLGVPSAELEREIAALRLYDGRGSARLIDADHRLGALLLERLAPGRMLAELFPDDDGETTRIAARLMKRLWRPLPADHAFETVARWARGFQRLRDCFQGGTGPLPDGLVAEAEAIYTRLLATTKSEVLLHGDLHHFNILSAAREPWLAIDPKGVAGDPAYEAGALLRNPTPDLESHPDLGRILARRLDILAEELQIERRRLQDWALAQVVLSAWWSYEDEGRCEREWLAVAEQIQAA